MQFSEQYERIKERIAAFHYDSSSYVVGLACCSHANSAKRVQESRKLMFIISLALILFFGFTT